MCEALYFISDWEQLSSIIQVPLLKARCFDDKLNTYNTLVRYLQATGDMKGVIEKCKSVLSQLGLDLPDPVDESVIWEEIRLVEQLLKDKSEAELISLPQMTNERKMASMQFLSHAISSAFVVDPLLSPILVGRIVGLSIKYGVCEISSFGFAGQLFSLVCPSLCILLVTLTSTS